MAQDDYYYEIQLTNKQLVFYFMAGAAGLILSFLAGVMVGRSVEGPAQAGAMEARKVAEESVVAESPAPAATPEPGYTYSKTLEGERRPDDRLERPGGAAQTPAPRAATPTPRTATPTPRPTPATTARPAPSTTPTPAATLPTPPAPRPAAAGPLPKPLASNAVGFAIQVGAFKDKATADGVVKSLKTRGLPAYAVTTGAGLFTVRVGVYRDRADAETVQDRLRDDKFKPYILKQ